jgi:hypothetical protein
VYSRHRGRVPIAFGFRVLLPVQSVPIITKVVNLNPAHGEVYSIQLYVIKYLGFYHRESIDDRLAITKDFLSRHKEGLAFGEST